jgi:hypothetical protein
LKACGFILNLQAATPQHQHSEWRLISRGANVAREVQFGRAAKRKPVAGLLRLLATLGPSRASRELSNAFM